MSVGDLKDSGNQGTNFPWQLKVLKGLQCICDEIQTIDIDTSAIETLISDIITQLQTGVSVSITDPIGQKVMDDSVSVTLASDQTGAERIPGVIRPNNTSGNLSSISTTIYSVSVANVGTASGTVLGTQINPGEVLNFSADAINNYFTSFAYNATGTEFVIIYVV
jgi:hypothetical protein